MQIVMHKDVFENPVEEKIENIENEENTLFDKYELKNFVQEIKDMVIAGKEIDIQKAIRNARYLAKIDRADEDIKAGRNCITFTDEEWEAFINAQDLS